MTKLLCSSTQLPFFYLLLLTFLSLGCSSDDHLVDLREVDGELVGREIPISTFIYKPQSIALMDDKLVVHDRVENNMFKFFSYPDVEFLFSWGRKGKGPDEILFVNPTGFLASGDTFSFLDRYTFKTYKISSSNELSLVDKIQLDYNQGTLNDVSLLNDSVFIANLARHIKTNSEYIFLYPNQKTGDTFGEFPETGFEFDPYHQKYSYFLRRNVVNREKERIMVFYMRMNLFRIYDYEGNLIKETEFDAYSPPEKTFYWRTFGLVNATDNYVYVLYSNAMTAEKPEDYEPLPQDLLILNWEGEVLKRYDLNVLISDFAISEKHKKIYALPINGGENIIEFDLPEM